MSKDGYLHTKTVFFYFVHKTTYEYDEHSYNFWKKITHHVIGFLV